VGAIVAPRPKSYTRKSRLLAGATLNDQTITLTLTDAAHNSPLTFTSTRVVLAGYTGRDRAIVQHHIDELKAQGIPAPERAPEAYPGLPSLIQVDGTLPAGNGWSSGEVEFVLLTTERGVYVGVGSDHTDRDLERTAMVPAKQAFPKILGSHVWPLAQLADGWDGLVLRSWITRDGTRSPYQEGSVAMIMTPEDLLEFVGGKASAGLVVYSGTVPAVVGPPTTGRCRFEGELSRPDGQILASCSYAYEAGPRRPS
jgi:hypothetical protein